MTSISKPLLHPGFTIRENLSVIARVEKIFFTEIYSLSGGKFLYLFLNLRKEDIISNRSSFEIVNVKIQDQQYICAISENHSQDIISTVSDELTSLRGFDCVAGMDNLKKLLMEEVIDPLLNPEKFKKFKLSVPNGILLFGPPGCGKTFIIRKLAEEINYNFFEIKHSDVASPYIHGSVEKISRIFEIAKLKKPSIVFIDELDGLLPKREDMSSSSQHKQEEINEFLMQFNDANDNGILIVGATNRPHLIDTAILRSGRMDKRIFVPPPDTLARLEMFRMCLSGRPFDQSIDFDNLAKLTENYVSSDIELIVDDSARMAVANNSESITEDMIVSVINNRTSSLSQEELAYYQQFISLERS
jgi:transitional endoplasmic reticulum ATPase